MQNFLDFEKPLLEIRTKIEELRHLKDDSKNIANELSSLQDKYDNALSEIYKNLTPWQEVKICRHQDRPKFFDYVNNIFEDGTYLLKPKYYPSLRYAEIIKIKFAQNVALDDMLFNTKGMRNAMKQSERICFSDYELEDSKIKETSLI